MHYCPSFNVGVRLRDEVWWWKREKVLFGLFQTFPKLLTQLFPSNQTAQMTFRRLRSCRLNHLAVLLLVMSSIPQLLMSLREKVIVLVTWRSLSPHSAESLLCTRIILNSLIPMELWAWLCDDLSELLLCHKWGQRLPKVTTGLHLFVGGSTGDGYNLLCFDFSEKIYWPRQPIFHLWNVLPLKKVLSLSDWELKGA